MAWWHLALLERECIGASNRRITYAARMVVALGAGLIALLELLQASTPGLGDPAGAEVLATLASCLLVLFAVAIPIQGVTAITGERERGTLALVLLTGIRPSRLILQLWLGQCLGWLSVVLAVAPVLALAQAYGGISSSSWWSWLGLLGMAVLVLSALALAVGAACRTTGAGITRAYLLVIAIGLGLPVAASVLHHLSGVAWSHVLLALCLTEMVVLLASATGALRRGAADGMAKRQFRTFDGAVHLRDRWVYKRGWISSRHLPEQEPVRWREEYRRQSRVRRRNLIGLHGIGAMCAFFSLFPVAPICFDVLALAVLVALVHASCTWAATERETQHWPLLVVSPLQARGTLLQKRRALQALVRTSQSWLLLSAVLGLIGWHWWQELAATGLIGITTAKEALIVGACEGLGAVLLPLAAVWLGLGVGAGARTTTTAFLRAAIAVATVLFLPPLLTLVLPPGGTWLVLCALLFPAELLTNLQEAAPTTVVALGGLGLAAALVLWIGIAWALRAVVLHPRFLAHAAHDA